MDIEQIIRQSLGADRVVRVDISRDNTDLDSPVLRIRVIYDESTGKLDLNSMLELPRRIREVSSDLEVTGFPVISYVDRTEEPVLHAAQ